LDLNFQKGFGIDDIISNNLNKNARQLLEQAKKEVSNKSKEEISCWVSTENYSCNIETPEQT